MYQFRDTTDASDNRVLPSEALKINGEYIEDLIPGYRTLYVTGREALSPELEYTETGNRDGATLKNKRYPARTIVVGYQLMATSNTAFRSAFNTLGDILDVTDAELIFNDEQDKYYIGTPSAIGEVEPGRNAVVGEIEFTCTDPFKYSVNEYEVVPNTTDKCFYVTYNGTYKAFPKLEAQFYSENETDGDTENELTGDGDCGYVAFFNEYEKIIQLGDPEEDDGEDMAKAQTLTNQAFKKANSWGTAAQKGWPINGSRVSDSTTITQTGTLHTAKSYAEAGANEYYLTPNNYGSGAKWHGPSIRKTLPADASGEVGATAFTCTWRQKLCIATGNAGKLQRGGFQILLTGANGKTVAGVNIYKPADGKKGKMRFYVNGKIKQTIDIDLSFNNKYFGQNREANKKKGIKAITSVKTSSITKQGKNVIFNIGGVKKTFTDPTILDLAVTQINITMTKWGTKPALEHNGLYWVKFVKNNCDTWREVPNKFSADDVVMADCNTGEIFLNDSGAPELGALGNDWEEFYLVPGLNQIGYSYSDWVDDEYKPTFKLKYREVYL